VFQRGGKTRQRERVRYKALGRLTIGRHAALVEGLLQSRLRWTNRKSYLALEFETTADGADFGLKTDKLRVWVHALAAAADRGAKERK